MFLQLEKDLIIIFNTFKVDPDIRRVIRSMVKTNEMEQSPTYNRNYVRTLSKQRKIGRDSLFFGFCTKKLVNQQTEYMTIVKEKNDKQQDRQAIKQIIITMLEFVHQLWLTRNGHLHRTDISTAPSYKRLQLL